MALGLGKKNANSDNPPDVMPPSNMDTTSTDFGGPAPQRKRLKPLGVVLGVVVLAALGGGAYMMFGMPPEEEEFAPPPMASRPPGPPGAAPGAPPPPGAPGAAPGMPPAPGAPPAAGAPPAPRVAGAPGAPGRPPVGAPRAGVKPAAAPAAAISPQLRAQLKQLWDKGAAAKHRNDYKGARAAWQQILQLRPGHPGIQDAIDKLPPR